MNDESFMRVLQKAANLVGNVGKYAGQPTSPFMAEMEDDPDLFQRLAAANNDDYLANNDGENTDDDLCK